MTFEEWVDENIKYIRTPDIFQWLFEAWESGAKAEREACAKVCEENAKEWSDGNNDWCSGQVTGSNDCAAAIRARCEK